MIKKLNFGCGNKVMKGWDNVDIQPEAPISWDLNKFPYKFAKSNTYAYIWINSVLEYLNEPEKVLYELWRICKPDAEIEITAPYYNNKAAYKDMRNKHYFSEEVFERIILQPYKIKSKKNFKIIKLELKPTSVGKYIPSKWLRKKLSLFIGGIIGQVYVKLKVLK